MVCSYVLFLSDQIEMIPGEQTVCNTPVTSFVCLCVFSSLVLALLNDQQSSWLRNFFKIRTVEMERSKGEWPYVHLQLICVWTSYSPIMNVSWSIHWSSFWDIFFNSFQVQTNKFKTQIAWIEHESRVLKSCDWIICTWTDRYLRNAKSVGISRD